MEGHVVSHEQRLLQCTYPREELCQRRRVLVPTQQPLPMAAQTQQGSVFDGYVDVVAVGLDLLSERAVVAAEDGLEQQRFTCERLVLMFFFKVYLCHKSNI